MNDPTRDFILGTTKQFSEQFRPVRDAHFYFSYNDPAGALELMPYVDLYSPEAQALLTDIKFKKSDMAFKFSKPADYRANDSDWTNEQDFINVTESGRVTINTDGKWFVEGGLKAAEGRTPVVRVDAFMKPNKKHLPNPFKDKEDENYSVDGEWELVASAYIKICITEKATPVQLLPIAPAIPIVIGNVVEPYDYRDLGGIDFVQFWADKHTANLLDENGINVKETISTGEKAWVEVGRMPWERINRELYGAQGESSVTFWDEYGAIPTDKDHNYFYVKIEETNTGKIIYPSEADMTIIDRYTVDNGTKKSNPVKVGKVHNTNEMVVIAQDGIFVRVELHDNGETSTFVQVGINNEVKTQHTYGTEEIDQANYKVTLTIPSENRFVYGDYELTQTFAVKDCCPDYAYNYVYNQKVQPLDDTIKNEIKADLDKSGIDDAFVVKGHLVGNDWIVREQISEAFEVVTYQDIVDALIFEYYQKWNWQKKSHLTNVQEIGFSWVDDHYVSDIKENGKRVKHWAGAEAVPYTSYANMITPVNPHTTNNDQHLFVDNEFITSDEYLTMEATMLKNFYIKTMNLTQWLVNDEHCGQTYNVVFLNPFIGEKTGSVKIYANSPENDDTARKYEYDVRDKAQVKDIYDDLLLATWNSSSKQFDVKKNLYGIDTGEVVYINFEWDKEMYDAAAANIENLREKLALTTEGIITWNNMGTQLYKSQPMEVIATIAIKRTDSGQEDLCHVQVRIPVDLAAERHPLQ